MAELRNLLVLGASSEVGCALIHSVKNQYEFIYAHYMHEKEELLKLKAQLGEQLVLLKADLTIEDEIQHVLQQIKDKKVYPDHIVHLPSMRFSTERFHRCRREDFHKGLQISVHALIQILQELLPYMSKQKYGKIILMLSSCVLDKPPAFQSVYVTHKYALLGLMKSLSVEYASKNITVNAISPDMMETAFLSDIPELLINQNAQSSPLGRNLFVQDVIPAFQYLLSEGADTVTGVNLPVTGGIK